MNDKEALIIFQNIFNSRDDFCTNSKTPYLFQNNDVVDDSGKKGSTIWFYNSVGDFGFLFDKLYLFLLAPVTHDFARY